MAYFPVFLSVVCVLRDQSDHLESIVAQLSNKVSALVSDYEIIVVDNASDDESVKLLKKMTTDSGIPNLQVYALTKEVDTDTAYWAGLENALGDFIVVIDPLSDNIDFLSPMLEQATLGIDIVFAKNEIKPRQKFFYRAAFLIYDHLYQWLNGIRLSKEAPKYRVLTKRVVNFILQHPQPALTYRHIQAHGGFTRTILNYRFEPQVTHHRGLSKSIDMGLRLLVSNTRAPMRLVTSLSLFGAISNIIYSIYVVLIALFKSDVAQGWTSLSLQQSGMFFLISLVLLILGEYILNMGLNQGPSYHIGQEFMSAKISLRQKLNIEEIKETVIDESLSAKLSAV